MTDRIKAVVFDAYGTLFDVYSIGALAERLYPGHGTTISTLWRDKQIEYTRLVLRRVNPALQDLQSSSRLTVP